jgi:predicted DNA-binding transcriptional regulator YafY
VQLVRCVALLIALARGRRGVNVRQFAERHGWSWRAVYRDIETLRAAGVPVDHEHGWYRVPESWLPAGTVDVKPDELMALCVARQIAPGLKDTAIGRALDSLWSKLSTPGRQPSLALGDETWFRVGPPAAIDYGPHQVALDAVRAAVRERRALQIRYRKPDGIESDRVIEPVLVRWDAPAEALYVFAWCRMRDEMRTFAIHRIVRAELTKEPFAPRRGAVVEMSNAFRLWSRPSVERVVLRFSRRVAGEIRERRWHPTARMTDTDDGGVVLEMEVAASDELERLLLGYGADVAIDAPVALATRVHDRHAEAIAPARLGTLRSGRTGRPAQLPVAQRAPAKP